MTTAIVVRPISNGSPTISIVRGNFVVVSSWAAVNFEIKAVIPFSRVATWSTVIVEVDVNVNRSGRGIDSRQCGHCARLYQGINYINVHEG